MKVKIRGIREPGNLEKERVVMEVLQDTDIGLYIVFATVAGRNENTVSSLVKRTFWFPDKQVKANDLVILYTKAGSSSDQKNEDATTSHFFYWGLSEPLWTSELDRVVLVETSSWTAEGIETAKGVETGA